MKKLIKISVTAFALVLMTACSSTSNKNVEIQDTSDSPEVGTYQETQEKSDFDYIPNMNNYKDINKDELRQDTSAIVSNSTILVNMINEKTTNINAMLQKKQYDKAALYANDIKTSPEYTNLSSNIYAMETNLLTQPGRDYGSALIILFEKYDSVLDYITTKNLGDECYNKLMETNEYMNKLTDSILSLEPIVK